MDAYKCNVVVVIKVGGYIHGVFISMGAYYPDFTVAYFHEVLIFVIFVTSSGVTKFGTHKFSACTMNCMNYLGRVLLYYCILLTVL